MNSEELLSALIRLSRIDEYFDEFEFAYLLKVGHHLGIMDTKVESMIKNSTFIPMNIPRSEEERMTILYHMLFLMKIDKHISEEEKELVHFYGFKLGFSAEMINDFVKVIEKNKDGSVDTQDMLSIIRKYQN